MWVQSYDRCVEHALELGCVERCNPSSSPSVGKSTMDGDDEFSPDGKTAPFHCDASSFLFST
jgi:hypothetical protein